MGASFALAQVNLNFVNVTNDISERISSTCVSKNTQTNSASNVQIKYKGVHCSNIQGVVQANSIDATCAENETFTAVQQNLASQISNLQSSQNAVPGSLTFAGIQFSMQVSDLSNRISNTMRAVCDSGNTQTNTANNAEVNMTGVSCGTLKALEQDATSSSQCAIQQLARLYQSNTALQKNSTSITSNGWLLYIGIGIGVVAAVTALSLILAHTLHKDCTDLATGKKMTPESVARLAKICLCDRAAGTQHAPPECGGPGGGPTNPNDGGGSELGAAVAARSRGWGAAMGRAVGAAAAGGAPPPAAWPGQPPRLAAPGSPPPSVPPSFAATPAVPVTPA